MCGAGLFWRPSARHPTGPDRGRRFHTALQPGIFSRYIAPKRQIEGAQAVSRFLQSFGGDLKRTTTRGIQDGLMQSLDILLFLSDGKTAVPRELKTLSDDFSVLYRPCRSDCHIIPSHACNSVLSVTS